MDLPKIETAEDMEFVKSVLKSHGDAARAKRIRKSPTRPKVSNTQAEELSTLLDIDLLRAEQARRSLSKFVEYGWHVLNPIEPYVHNWHIDAIADHLEAVAVGHIKNLLVNIPPRHSKSTLATICFPAWIWASWPTLRFICASHSLSLSQSQSKLCRSLISSPWYQRAFGHVYRITSDNIGEISNDKMGYRIATSVGASIIGRGGNIVIVDDPHDPREGGSKAVIEAAVQWYDNVLSTRFEGDPKQGRRVLIMQRISDRDLSGHVLHQAGWETLILPMEFDPKRRCFIKPTNWKDPRTKKGELLDTHRFDQEWVDFWSGSNKTGKNPKNVGKLTSSAWSGQFQQDPVPEGGSIIKLQWLEDNYYKEAPMSIYEQAQRVIATFDMSFKDRATSDYTVMCVWGKIGPNIYLIDMVRARMAFVETRVAVKKLLFEYPKIGEKLVEDRANGPAIVSELKSMFPGFISVNPDNSSTKQERLEAISWIVEAGNLKLPDPDKNTWVRAVIEEITRFPASEFDDIVDNCTMALDRLKTLVIDPNLAPLGVGVMKGRDKQWSYGDPTTLNDASPFTRKWGYGGR